MPDIIAKGFTRVNEAVAPDLLRDGELAALTNGVLDAKQGAAVKRYGWTRLNTNSVTDDIISLHDVVDSAGTNHLLATKSGASSATLIRAQDGSGSWSNVKTSLTKAYRTRIMPIGGGKYIVTNGINTPFIIGGANFASTWDLGLLRPETSGLVGSLINDGGGGGLTANASYLYILVNVAANGDRSEPSRPFTFLENNGDGTVDGVLLASTRNTRGKLYFGNLPSTSTDTRVTSVRIYRTKRLLQSEKYDGSRTFYYLKSLNTDTTSFYDEAEDTDLAPDDFVEFLTIPTVGKYLAYQFQRLFIAYPTISNKTLIEPPYSAATGSAPTGYTDGYAFQVTAEDGVADGLEDESQYVWRVVFVDTNGNESGYVDTAVYTTGGVAPNNTRMITLTNIPTASNGQNNLPIAFKRIYRSLGDGVGLTYYKVADIDLDQTDYEDRATDNYLVTVIAEPYAVPITTAYPNAVLFSEVGRPSTITEGNLVNVFPDDGDVITGIHDDNDGIIVFKKYSVCKIYTLGSPENWRVVKLVEGVGCTEPDTLMKNDNEYFFICNKQAYIYRAGGVQDVGEPFKTTLQSVTTWNAVTYDPVRKWYVLGVVITTTHFVLVYDTKVGSWYKFSITKANALAYKKYGLTNNLIIVGDGAYVIKYDTSTQTDNEAGSSSAVQMNVKTKTYVVPEGIGKMRLRKYWANYYKTASVDVTNIVGDGSGTDTVQAADSTGSGDKTYQAVTDAMVSGGSLKLCTKVYFSATGVGLQEFYGAKLRYTPINRGSRV